MRQRHEMLFNKAFCITLLHCREEKKAFSIIKQQRQKLKTLNYLELNTFNDMKAINNM
jgi:hypothetical protein